MHGATAGAAGDQLPFIFPVDSYRLFRATSSVFDLCTERTVLRTIEMKVDIDLKPHHGLLASFTFDLNAGPTMRGII